MKRLLYKSPCVTVTDYEAEGVFCTSLRTKRYIDEAHALNEETDETERYLFGM
ncbi:MAG: hypothetical protein J6N80_08245 [Bacteroidales bacterium]|nr:hypothetical protein [Bacteroidales bacterium]